MSTTTEPQQLTETAADERRAALESRVVLLSPTMSYFRGQYILPKNTKVMMGDHEVDEEKSTRPRSKLMTNTFPTDSQGKPWLRRFRTIETEVNKLIGQYSIPLTSIRGLRVVPRASAGMLYQRLFGKTVADVTDELDEMMDGPERERMQNIMRNFNRDYPRARGADPAPPLERDELPTWAYEFFRAKNEFCANWEDIKRQMRQHTDTTVYDAIECKLPSEVLLPEKFNFSMMPVELAGSMDSNPETIGRTELEAYGSVVRDAVNRTVETAIQAMIERPQQELAAALASMQELIARDGRVTSATFDSVRSAMRRVRAFDFVADSAILQQMDALDGLLDQHTPSTLNSVTAAQNGFSAALGNYLEEVNNEQRRADEISSFGRNFRGLDLDDD